VRVPPWLTMERRAQWAREHPYAAALYFGVVMAVFFTLLFSHEYPFLPSVLGGAGAGALGIPLYAWGLRRRFRERPDADAAPPTTMVRIWSRTSDRAVFWMMVIAAAAIVVLAVNLASGAAEPVLAWISLACAVWFALTAWAERRRR
jgi:hypothetical protein